MATSTAPGRGDIDRQRVIDGLRSDRQVLLHARMRAVVTAQAALARRELGARPSLRQALIDLAAIAELLADELPADQEDAAPEWPESSVRGTGYQ